MIEIRRVARIDIAFEPWTWPFATQRRREIDRHFAERRRKHSGIWNGRVLLLKDQAVADGTLHARCFEADYASFLAWRDWDFPDPSVHNFFAAGALRASDGAYLLGEMAAHTANAGSIYFPCGTPEPDDVIAGRVDLAGSIAREISEETGLDAGDFDAPAGWTVVVAGSHLAFIKTLTARWCAHDIHARMLEHLTREPQPELAAIHIVRSPADFDPRMPPYVSAFLSDAWTNK